MTNAAPETELPPSEDAPAPAGASESPQTFGEVFRRLGPAGYLAVAWAAMPIVGSILLWANVGAVGDWLLGHKALGIVLYIAIFIFSAGFGLLPTYAQALLAGWVFGVVVGVPAALAGVTGAALVGYIVGRTVSEDRAEQLIAENAKARAVRDALIGRGFWKTLGIVTLLRLPINSPFALTNLVMASAGVSKRAFVIGTAVGMAPRTTLAVYLAANLQELSKDAVDQAKPAWVTGAAIGSAIVVFGFIAWLGDRAVKKAMRPGPASDAASK